MNKPILLLFLFTLFLKPTAKAQQQHKKQAHPSPQLNTRHAVPNLKALGNKLSQRKPIDPCGTVDYMNSIRQNNPKWESIDHFETWLSKNIQEKQQKGSTAIDGMVIEIPYVVHIIHDGTPINAVGQVLGYNISAAQVASQIRVLNEDFSLTNPDRANSPQWDDRAANLGIKFVPALYHPDTGIPLEEPGINRIDRNAFGFEPAPYETAYIETTIKPATAWNREDVINIWVMPLPLGLYGYAQFPSSSTLTGLEGYNGNSNTDGVVIAPFTFGSYADQDGSFITAQTQFGRTTTHEIGHWCGFRHIWGDGDCTQDDFVVDTPPQNGNSPFGSCNNGQNSCYDPDYGDYTTDLPDMKENFMDYSGDQCMNLFTKGQLARAEIVFDKSPGRGSLIHSTVDSLKKPILFMAPSSLNKTVDVNATCETYKEYKFDIRVAYNYTGSGSIKAQLKSIGGTAKLGEDYDIIGANEVTFTGGQAETQSVVIRVYNDINEENDESIDFELELIDASDTNVTLTDNSDFKTTSWLIKNASREEQIATISLLDDKNRELICFDNEALDLTIQFDSNPEETSWQIRNDQNQLVEYGGNYSNAQTSITEQINLPDGQYTFQIFDSGDNGLCCSTLDGNYSLSTKSGIILVSGARFKSQESTSFCLGTIQGQQPIVIGRNAQVAEDVHCDETNSLYYINAKINKCTIGDNKVIANIVVDGGSAKEGEDFIFPEKTFTFNGNEEQIIPISIEILNDAEAELIEDVTFHLEITDNDYAQIDSTAYKARLEIIDADSPVIQITPNELSTSEGVYGCTTENKNVTFSVALLGCHPTSEPVSLELSVNAQSSASEGVDFIIPNKTILFDGQSTKSSFNLEVINDFKAENDEDIVLDISLTSGNGSLLQDQIIIHLSDPIGNAVINTQNGLFENFEAEQLPEGWSFLNFAADQKNAFTLSANPALSGQSAHISSDAAGTKVYNYVSPFALSFMISPTIKLTTDASLDFMYKVFGEFDDGTIYDFGGIGILPASTNINNPNAVLNDVFVSQNLILLNQPNGTTLKSLLPNYNYYDDLGRLLPNQEVRLVFYWYNDDFVEGNPPLAIDNIAMPEAYSGIEIAEHILRPEEQADYKVLSNEKVSFFNKINQEMVLSIQSAADVGCAAAQILTEGSGAFNLFGKEQAQFVLDKTLSFTSETSSDSEATVDLYYTREEIKAWENITGNNKEDIYIYKMDNTSLTNCFDSNITLDINFDDYSEEVYWVLQKANGDIVSTSSPYSSGLTTYTDSFSLEPGQYIFTIYDLQNDGICCNYGYGNYSLSSENHKLVKSGLYGFSESTAFCVGENNLLDQCSEESNLTYSKAEISPFGNGYKLTARFDDGIRSQSVFAAGSLSFIQPSTFIGKQNQEQIDINFTFEDNQNDIEEFIIERLNQEQSEFVEIVRLPYTGSTNYSTEDLQPYYGLNTYRLRILLKNGFVVENCTLLEVEYSPTDTFKLVPNPVIDQLIVLISNNQLQGRLHYSIYDHLGRLYLERELPLNGDVTRHILDVSALAAGQYYLRAKDQGQFNDIRSFIKANNQ